MDKVYDKCCGIDVHKGDADKKLDSNGGKLDGILIRSKTKSSATV